MLPVSTPFSERRVVFDVSCPRCSAPMPVDAEALAERKAILISIDPCTTCGYDLPLERWDAARAHARRLLGGGA